MPTRSLSQAVAVLVFAALLPPAFPAAGRPIKDFAGPEAYTQAQYYEDALTWHQAQMVETYLTSGLRSPAWDEAAEKMLRGTAILFTNNLTDRRYHRPGLWGEARIRTAEDLLNAGCDDPMVLYCVAKTLRHEKRYGEAREVSRVARDGFLRSKYHPIYAAWAQGMIRADLESEDPDRHALQQSRDAEVARAFLRKGDSPFTKRMLQDTENLYGKSYTQLKAYYDVALQIDERDHDPYAYHLLAGFYEIKAAWEARGDGWAREVKPEGWVGFEDHLKLARDHLVEAWRLNPDHPIAAAKMITVVVGLNEGHAVERNWFERAIKAQLDYKPAYSSLEWAMRPRWGGSHEMMLAYAKECLNTDRYDTIIPSRFYNVIMSIKSDRGDYNWWVMNPELYALGCQYYQKRAQAPTGGVSAAWWRSMNAALAWRVEKYDAARQIMDELGDQLDARAFEKFDGDRKLTPSEVHARGGELAESVAAIFKWLEWKDYNNGLAALDQQIAALPADHPALLFLKRTRLTYHAEHVLSSNDWLPLLDMEGMEGWEVVEGDWSFDEQGRLCGVAGKRGMLIKTRIKPGVHLELRGEMTIEPAANQGNNELYGGVLMAVRKGASKHYHKDVVFYPDADEVHVGRNFHHALVKHALPIGRTVSFHIQLWEDVVHVEVDGHVVARAREWEEAIRDGDHNVAVGTCNHDVAEGSRITLQKLDLRLLNPHRAPDWVPQDEPEDAQPPVRPLS